MSVTVGSLFSGIGGLDLGLERAGMNVIWQSEIDPYACQVLAKHWPTIPNHGDIKTIDWTQIERPNIICGGYPCQPFSQAGKRAGTDDPRHLWPWVREAISHLRPDFAILENVRGHLSLGLTTVLGEMSEIGYDAEWQIISAAGVGAPHRRDRVFIIAYPDSRRSKISFEGEQPSKQLPCSNGRERKISDMAYPEGGASTSAESHSLCSVFGQATKLGEQGSGGRPLNDWWQVEPDVGRVANGVPSRVDRLKCLGNAVVPQVSEFVGRIVMECYQ